MEMINVVTIHEYDCTRCGHRWIPRKQSYPKRCPNCTSAYWDVPRSGGAEPPKAIGEAY